MTTINGASMPNYPMTSLYVGDLHPDVTEAMLFEKFSQAGPVLSIRVCRDLISRMSLGYAYINYQLQSDAEVALDTMNFDVIKGQPIRIMWSQRDPSLRRSGKGNIFIKNLHKTIDNKDMYDTFSTFGPILSCKVATDHEGNSKGYGFVHFETEESANKAIEKVNGMLLSDKKLFVGRFIPRTDRDRELGEKSKIFTNVFIKNLPEMLQEDKLRDIFEEFGTITSHRIMIDGETGRSRCFGFVAFDNPQAAERACNRMDGRELDGKIIYVGRAQKRGERQMELKRKFDQLKLERIARYEGVNLYVKNLDDTIDDNKLRTEFQTHGIITSAKVMREDERSRGFGFVCFSSPEEATKAVTDMNGKIVGTKPLYVALAQRKEDRRAHLTSQYIQRIANMNGDGFRLPQMTQVYNFGNYFVPTITAPQNLYTSAGMPVMRQTSRWQSQVRPGVVGQGQNTGFATIPTQFRSPRTVTPIPHPGQAQSMRALRQIQHSGSTQYGQVNGLHQSNLRNFSIGSGHQINSGVGNSHVSSVPPPSTASYKYCTTDMRSGMVQQSGELTANLSNIKQEPLSTSALAAANPNDQKQMLGERLYPLIQAKYPRSAGKVTGMLLEMDNSEILHMLEDQDLLYSRMEEAMVVLYQHKPKPLATPPDMYKEIKPIT